MTYAAPASSTCSTAWRALQPGTPEGLLARLRRFGGTLFSTAQAFAGATTGQQLPLRARRAGASLRDPRRRERQGISVRAEKIGPQVEFRDSSGWSRRGRIARGSVAQGPSSRLEIAVVPGEALCLATGRPRIVFGKSTQQRHQHGHRCERRKPARRVYANGEFIQVHPPPSPGADKAPPHLESVRGEGGRIWVPKDAKEKRRGKDVQRAARLLPRRRSTPGYGNLVPRDIAARELFLKGFHETRGVYNNKKRQERARGHLRTSRTLRRRS